MPKVYGKQQVELISKLAGRKVAIIADETSDVAGRYVLNILLQPRDAFHPDDCKAVLVIIQFLAIAQVIFVLSSMPTLTSITSWHLSVTMQFT